MRAFLDTEAAGGIVLLGATIVALVWVNTPFRDVYDAIWTTELRLSFGSFELAADLRHWVNDALMAIFFFVVGLEIKRELVVGELSDLRKAALPALAAVGGMVVPAGMYLLFNTTGPGARGWGIPMATDIAFAVGVLALLGPGIPAGLKVFLLSLAIVDDIGAILVIAVFYSHGLHLGWLAVAGMLLLLTLVLRRVRVLWMPVYVVIGGLVWLATFRSGVHATIAGVVLGLVTPARPTDPDGFADIVDRAAALPREPDAAALREMSLQAQEVVSAAERLEHVLHPWTSYVVVPLFALANAGVVVDVPTLRNAATSDVTLGIVAGLVIGKIVGISGVSWAATRLGIATPPAGVSLCQIFGASAVAGIGFTVSLFIAGLAFTDRQLLDAAKMGVMAASVIAGVVGSWVLRARCGRSTETSA